MEKAQISHTGQPRLIALFLGWGMDATPFSKLCKPGYDITIFFNYTGFDPKADAEAIALESEGYGEIVVAAWSFGVRVAADLLRLLRPILPITSAIAVNGTETHIHPRTGIHPAIFNGTLANLSETSVRKFRRRMCADAASFAAFQAVAPQRTFQSLLDELHTFASMPSAPPHTTSPIWDYAVTGGNDAIFTPQAQIEAWREMQVPCQVVERMPHMPDMQNIIDGYVVDKELVAERFSSALHTYRSQASVQRHAAQRLWNLTVPHVPRPANGRSLQVLEIGAGSGLLTDMYMPVLQGNSLTLWDIAPIDISTLPQECKFKCCDAEAETQRLYDGAIDLILSASTLQWFNSPTAFIGQLPRVLAPGGIAALSLYGQRNCCEIAQATGETLRYPTIEALATAATEASLEIVDMAEETLTLTFPSIRQLLRHLKQTGVNALNRTPATANTAALRLRRHYPLLPDGSAPLTYHPIYIVLRRRASNN